MDREKKPNYYSEVKCLNPKSRTVLIDDDRVSVFEKNSHNNYQKRMEESPMNKETKTMLENCLVPLHVSLIKSLLIK